VALSRLSRLTVPVAMLLIWQAVSTFVLDDTTRTLLPPPTAVAKAAWELIVSGELLRHLRDSLRREFIAFAWALTAVPVGVAMGWWKRVHDQLDPLVEMLRPIPPLAWIPLSILWFGVGDTQNQFIIFLGIFFPILLNTIAGVKSVEPNLVRAARCLGGGEGAVLRRVVLRAALPQIVTGIRVGLGFGWMALVAAELVGANSGLGFLINDARTLLRTDVVIVGMITIGIVGLVLLLYTGVRWVGALRRSVSLMWDVAPRTVGFVRGLVRDIAVLALLGGALLGSALLTLLTQLASDVVGGWMGLDARPSAFLVHLLALVTALAANCLVGLVLFWGLPHGPAEGRAILQASAVFAVGFQVLLQLVTVIVSGRPVKAPAPSGVPSPVGPL